MFCGSFTPSQDKLYDYFCDNRIILFGEALILLSVTLDSKYSSVALLCVQLSQVLWSSHLKIPNKTMAQSKLSEKVKDSTHDSHWNYIIDENGLNATL